MNTRQIVGAVISISLFSVLPACGGEYSPLTSSGRLEIDSESGNAMTGRFFSSGGTVLEFATAIAGDSSIMGDVFNEGRSLLHVTFKSGDTVPSVELVSADPATKLAAQELVTALTAKFAGQPGASAAGAAVLSVGLSKLGDEKMDIAVGMQQLARKTSATPTQTGACNSNCCKVWGWACCNSWGFCAVGMYSYCC